MVISTLVASLLAVTAAVAVGQGRFRNLRITGGLVAVVSATHTAYWFFAYRATMWWVVMAPTVTLLSGAGIAALLWSTQLGAEQRLAYVWCITIIEGIALAATAVNVLVLRFAIGDPPKAHEHGTGARRVCVLYGCMRAVPCLAVHQGCGQ